MHLSVLPFSRLFYAFLFLLATTGAGYAQPTRAATARHAKPPTASLRTGTPLITTSDGVKLYVKVAGKGLPCVFIHGGPGAGSQDIEMLAGPYLDQRFQMIYLDQRGSGRSASSSQQDYTLARVVQDVEEVRQQLHLSQWVVMAHSFGGIIATAYASKYPERVQGLLLVNSILNLPASMEATVAYGYPLLAAQGRPPLDPAAPLPQRYGMVTSLLNQQKRLSQLMYAQDSTALRVKRVRQGVPANGEMSRVITQSAAIADYVQDFTVNSASLSMPVLVVTGQQDYIVGPEQYKSFRFPHQQVLVLPSKHYALLENPTELTQAFLTFSTQLTAKK
jgi:proline iminopeptidase